MNHPDLIDHSDLEAELEKAVAALADAELEHRILLDRLDAAGTAYRRAIGDREAVLASLKAEHQRVMALRMGLDPDRTEQVVVAERQARRIAEELQADPDDLLITDERTGTSTGAGDTDLKSRYRALAQQLHPDLAADDADRERRNELMAELNEAYRRRDYATFDRLEATALRTAATPLGSTARQFLEERLEVVRQALAEVRRRIADLASSPLGQLADRIDHAAAKGSNLLAALAEELDHEIVATRQRIERTRNRV